MAKKVLRKIIGGLLVIMALVVYLVPSEPLGAETPSTTDFELNGSTLVKYSGTAQTVSIPDSVEIIGEEAFADNNTVYSVKIPGTVEKISYGAFSGCKSLSKVNIPDSVEEIGTAAFCNCSSLSEVNIGSGLKKLGAGVFTGCALLDNVKIASGRFAVKDGVIYDKDKTKIYQVLGGKKEAAFSMPNTVTNIVQYAFYGCNNLNAVTISSNLQDIPAYSFSNCNGLSTVSIPYSVNNIDAKAFENCVNLSDVDIPESVTYIHPTAFDGCPRLNIVAPEFTYAYNWFNNMDRSQVSIIDSEDNSEVNEKSQESSSGNEKENPEPEYDESEPAPKNMEDVAGSYIVSEGLIGESVVVGRKAFVFINNTEQTVIDGVQAPEDTSEYSEIVTEMSDILDVKDAEKGIGLPKFAIIGDKIAGKAFYGDETLKDYEISPEIKSIGDFSFARSGLKSIEIPEGVTHIGYGAFYHCDNLSNIIIPSTVTDIEPAAFSKTRMLENWMEYGSTDYFICGDGILAAYRGKDSKITIPEGVKKIGPEAFKDHKGITDVFLPDSLIEIGEDAFSGCSNLKNVTGGINLVNIEDRAFAGCPLECIRIVDTVRSIGLGAYDFDKAKVNDENSTVVFLGNSLPVVSYNKTATRLSNEDYRKDALKGVKVAIVSGENVVRDGTVLDRNQSGFGGLICTISEENNEYFNGKLNIIDCTLTPEEAAMFSVPMSMVIFGKGYNFDVTQLDSVLNMAKEGSRADISGNEGRTLTGFDGSDRKYEIEIVNDESVDNDIKDGYMRIYGDTVPANMSTFSISLKEENCDIPLTKFGKQKLQINMTLPSKVPSTNLHVICIDEDDQLEDLSYKLVEKDGKLVVCFDISHTGKYGFYSFNSTAVSKYNLDETPDTSDKVNPKTVLSLGLLFAGLALILIKGKR